MKGNGSSVLLRNFPWAREEEKSLLFCLTRPDRPSSEQPSLSAVLQQQAPPVRLFGRQLQLCNVSKPNVFGRQVEVQYEAVADTD
jgi:hypothetical protein